MKIFTAFTNISLISLIVGFTIGYLAQRSRMCFIGGWRDFFLIRDTYLLKGFIAFLVTAVFCFFLFDSSGYYLGDYPWFARPPITYEPIHVNPLEVQLQDMYRNMSYCEFIAMPITLVVGVDIPIRGVEIFGVLVANELLLTLAAALLLGFFSTLANGCPVRQHVMASSGNATSVFYLLGFYSAIVFYDKFIVEYMNKLVNIF